MRLLCKCFDYLVAMATEFTEFFFTKHKKTCLVSKNEINKAVCHLPAPLGVSTENCRNSGGPLLQVIQHHPTGNFYNHTFT